jgi:hypothetical protein
MRRESFWMPAARAVFFSLALAAATIVDWLMPVRIEVSPDGRLVPTR